MECECMSLSIQGSSILTGVQRSRSLDVQLHLVAHLLDVAAKHQGLWASSLVFFSMSRPYTHLLLVETSEGVQV